jgi:hypothetical protein
MAPSSTQQEYLSQFLLILRSSCLPTSPNDADGIPATTIVLDEDTGGVKAIVNARSLTALRTAAGCVSFVLFLMCSVNEQHDQAVFLHHTSLDQSALAQSSPLAPGPKPMLTYLCTYHITHQ